MKSALFHPKVRDILRGFPKEVRLELGKTIFDLQKGTKLAMPLSNSISSVGSGVEEIRIKDRAGAFRVFYLTRKTDAVLIFHAFQKKTQETPQKEIETGIEKITGDVMKKTNSIIAKDAFELAEALGLSRAHGLEIQIRSDLNDKIIDVVEKNGLTHAQVAKLAGASRTRITAIMNRNTKGISTDLMLRVIASLGVQAKIVLRRAA